MIARAIERRVPEGPGTCRPSASFPRQWAEIAGGGGPGAPALLRVRVANCLSRDPAWAVREVWATQALALRPTRTGRTYRLVVSFHPGERPSSAVLDDIEETLVSKRMGWPEEPDPEQEKKVRAEVYSEIETSIQKKAKREGLPYRDREQRAADTRRKLASWEENPIT